MKSETDSTVMASPEYRRFIEDLKARVVSARISAARAMNCDLILLYWDIGRGIAAKQHVLGWGDAVVEMVAADLRRAFPEMRGFSPSNVWRMRQLFLLHAQPDFLAQAARELGNNTPDDGPEQILAQVARELLSPIPWWHHVELMAKVKDSAAHFYYLQATARFGWTRNVLLNQIKAGAYERAVTEKKSHNFPVALPEHLAEQADEMLNEVHWDHLVRGKGRRGGGIRPARQTQSHRRGRLSTPVEIAGGAEGETADRQTACRRRALCASRKERPVTRYFYRHQPPTPAKELLAEFWKLEKEAEKMLEGLAK